MRKINRQIEIVSSRNAGLSSMGRQSRRAICALLARHYTNVRITLIDDAAGLAALVSRKPDLVFVGMKFVPQTWGLGRGDTNKIWVSDYLDQHDIAHTGSGGRAHELERNKALAKRTVLQAGLRTSPFFVASRHQPIVPGDIRPQYPVFIKPIDLGGGTGVDGASVAKNFYELAQKVRNIHRKFQTDALVEAYLPGREFSVAILKNQGDGGYVAMPIELVTQPAANGTSMLSYAVKTANIETVLEVREPVCRAQIAAFALDAFTALGAADYGRIDIRLDALGRPNFLEANLIPSLIDNYGSFPKACRLNRNISYETMILNIVHLGLARAGDATGYAPALFGVQPA